MNSQSGPMLECYSCTRKFPLHTLAWKCSCGGVLDVRGAEIFPKDDLGRRSPNLWRYREAFGLPKTAPTITLGEIMTPLLDIKFRGRDISLKLDHQLPTASYKDRGIAVCLNHLVDMGVRDIRGDSSGNAGASTAAYAAAADMTANIFVPDGTSPAKVNQIRIYRGVPHLVRGTRGDAAREAQKERPDSQYIGHSWNPFFAVGVKSVAFEIAEQMRWNVPDWIVTPAGGGSLVLGLIDGLDDLLAAGYIDRLPRILAVQSSACAPVYEAWSNNEMEVTGVTPQKTVAEGVALPNPPRGKQILDAVRRTSSVMMTVDDGELLSCWKDLAQQGVFVEPTAALAVAGADMAVRKQQIFKTSDKVVVLITGHGLKTKPTVMDTVNSR